MRLSTKGRYGVKAMFDLALNSSNEKTVTLKSIADRQGISEPYLEQLMASLRKAGLVKSVRGAHGGYMLSFAADQITIGDVIRTLEGSMAPTECVDESTQCDCSEASCCVTRMVWKKIKESVDGVIDAITIQDMLEQYKKMSGKGLDMYYI